MGLSEFQAANGPQMCRLSGFDLFDYYSILFAFLTTVSFYIFAKQVKLRLDTGKYFLISSILTAISSPIIASLTTEAGKSFHLSLCQRIDYPPFQGIDVILAIFYFGLTKSPILCVFAVLAAVIYSRHGYHHVPHDR